jgi:hypothetical protein
MALTPSPGETQGILSTVHNTPLPNPKGNEPSDNHEHSLQSRQGRPFEFILKLKQLMLPWQI